MFSHVLTVECAEQNIWKPLNGARLEEATTCPQVEHVH